MDNSSFPNAFHHPNAYSPLNGYPSSRRLPSMDGVNDFGSPTAGAAPLTNDPSFDILEWHPAYQSCQRFFLDHAQHEPATQALCALINIRLPFQWRPDPVTSSTLPGSSSNGAGGGAGGRPSTPGAGANFNFDFSRGSGNNGNPQQLNTPPSRSGAPSDQTAFVSLVPYIRRLVVTAFDKPPILHGLFGDEYTRGVVPHVDCERRNYLFAAKHGGWRSCKKQYDYGSGGGGDESVPFMKPLDEAKMEELTAAEKAWSSWLAMEDWMVGPRAPEDTSVGSSQRGMSSTGGERSARGVDMVNGGDGEYGAR